MQLTQNRFGLFIILLRSGLCRPKHCRLRRLELLGVDFVIPNNAECKQHLAVVDVNGETKAKHLLKPMNLRSFDYEIKVVTHCCINQIYFVVRCIRNGMKILLQH